MRGWPTGLPKRQCFNPTLVRLARAGRFPRGGRAHRFNPTLVRLAPTSLRIEATRADQFQSHPGSISTPEKVYNFAQLIRVSIPPWFD